MVLRGIALVEVSSMLYLKIQGFDPFITFNFCTMKLPVIHFYTVSFAVAMLSCFREEGRINNETNQ